MVCNIYVTVKMNYFGNFREMSGDQRAGKDAAEVTKTGISRIIG